MEQSLHALARELGLGERVQFAGVTDDPAGTLARAALLVIASSAEGMSNTLLEALATGTPAVATAVGANAELLRDGVGWIVPPEDEAALAAGLAAAMGDSEERVRRSDLARRRAAEYGIDAAARRYEEIYAAMRADGADA